MAEKLLNAVLLFVFIAAGGTVAGRRVCGANDWEAKAEEIIRSSGVKGGVIAHLGAGNGKLTCALRINSRFIVHGLEKNPLQVERAREYILKKEKYGPVSVERFSGSALPYADNLVNLIVAQDPGSVAVEEMLRVLVPKGVAYIKMGSEWKKKVKSRPENIDRWSHFLHDAGNNAVAEDTVLAPPRRVQWVGPPLWLRSHETPSGIQAQICSGERLFYIFDEGLIGITDERFPCRWSIICRDAFNGKLLWKRPLEEWGWREWDLARNRMKGKDWTKIRGMRTKVPNQNQCRLVAEADRVYATLSYKGPVSILDAASGEIVATVEGTKPVNQIRVDDGVGLAYVENGVSEALKRRGREVSVESAFVAFNGETGSVIWKKKLNLKVNRLLCAVNGGKVFFFTNRGRRILCLSMKDGSRIWEASAGGNPVTLVAENNTVVMRWSGRLAAYKAASGAELWERKLPDRGYMREDLFVIGGVVYPGVSGCPNVKARGFDLLTGKLKKKLYVENLTSPEHHHRCYRNKASTRFLITSMEGAEFLDLKDERHSQENWIRGACRYGTMPCNGFLYAPPDQCFCSPGSMFRGFAVLAPESAWAGRPFSEDSRLEKGEAYGVSLMGEENSSGDWPTYRHDSSRSGSTESSLALKLETGWKVDMKGRLTAPVAAGGRVFVARSNAHTLYALDMESGDEIWHFTAGGRIDSPPAIYRGLVLFGSMNGKVYCLKASNGETVWRFKAAPKARKTGYFSQLESAWPVHGSVLVEDGVVYFSAGRSTYLDGGIYLYGLDPASGKVIHKGHLGRPPLDIRGVRDKSFYTLGANSDLLVSEGGYIYMRQKKFTPELKEITTPEISNKGGMDVGLHVFSTASLLDGSWYNRTFWMYSKRWPGFQLANQAPKSGQLLVKDRKRTYAVKVFYRRNVHSPMFFPGKEGYLLFADKNTNEPQIVGEEGSETPVGWLPQSDYYRGGTTWRKLGSRAFARDKGTGYTRSSPALWKTWLSVRIRAMVKAGERLFAAGPPDVFDAEDPFGPFEGRKGGVLVCVSAENGKKLSKLNLPSPPVFDGMIAAGGRLFISLTDGTFLCLQGKGP